MDEIGLSEEQLKELAKCYNDPIYFIENYCWIEVKEKSKIYPAVLYPYQKEILTWLVNGESGLVLKSRRVGGSTVVALYLAWLINFRRGVNALLLSRTEKDAIKLLAKVKFAYFNIKRHTSEDFALAEDATWMLNDVAFNNQQLFAVGWKDDEGNILSTSEVASLTTTSESGRGESASFVFIDEMAFIEDQEGASRASRITTTRGGHWLAVSCQTPDAYVFTNNGIQQLEDFVNRDSSVGEFSNTNDFEILGINDMSNCNTTYNNGSVDTIKITTELNYTMECSREHPIVVNRNGNIDWVRAKDLQIGDWTPINRNNNCFGNVKIKHPYLLGLVLGDGHISKNRYEINITSVDEETKLYLINNYNFSLSKDEIHIRKCNKEIVDYFESIGYKFVTARYKSIPKQVMLSNRESQKLVLRGLFDADGCSTPDGRVSFVSTSELMVNQIRMMLLNFGITSAKYNKVSKPTKRVAVESEQWILEIGMDAWKFFEEVGFGLTRKQKNYNPNKKHSLKDIIPYGALLAKEISNDSKWSKPEFRNKRSSVKGRLFNKALKLEHKPLSYQTANKFLEYWKENSELDEYKKLQKLVESNYRWVKITKLENSFNETWDFSIPDDGSYVSNGFISHNTPNGVGDKFYEWCMAAMRGENKSYRFRKVHWSEAGMTQDMIDSATEGLSEASIQQEMEMDFISSGDPVFSHMHVSACYKPIDDYPDIKEYLQQYSFNVKRDKSVFYYGGVDTAIGKLSKKDSKRDYHCFTALTNSGVQAYTYTTKEKSLIEWAGNVEQIAGQAVRQEGIVSALHKEYPGILNVEINGPGQAVFINHIIPEDGRSNIVPKNTTSKTKEQLIRQLILAVESHSIVITDRQTFQEMIIYQRGSTPGTYSAPTGAHDDTVMALALAWDALLRSGGVEFAWGSTSDDLQPREKTKEEITNLDIVRMGYGPSIMTTVNSTERLSSYSPEQNYGMVVDSDLDISRVREPEFNA
jgi:intein/homing endonuclease